MEGVDLVGHNHGNDNKKAGGGRRGWTKPDLNSERWLRMLSEGLDSH